MEHTGFSLVIFHELGEEGIQKLDNALDSDSGHGIRALPGFCGLLRCDLGDMQITPKDPHSYEGLLLVSFDQNPTDQHIKDLSAWVQDLKDKGLIGGYKTHLFDWVRPLYESQQGAVEHMTHVNIVLGNANPGQDEGYHAWYDNHHVSDLLAAPGPVAFRRGALSSRQLSPANDHHAAYMVLMASRTDNFAEMTAELGARTFGTSTSGIQFEPRSPAVSDNRTIDVFCARCPLEGSI